MASNIVTYHDSEEDKPDLLDPPEHEFDSEENQKLLKKIENWWQGCQQAHQENREQQRIDEGFYDHEQLSYEDIATLEARGQSPAQYNKIKPIIDWLSGTERRTRIDYSILPRREEDLEGAKAKQKLMKYVSDTSRFGFEHSAACDDAFKVGVGWIEEGIRTDTTEEPIFNRHRSYREVWPDQHSRRPDLDDARFLFTAKWLDLDVAQAMWPDRAGKLDEASVQSIFADSDYPDQDADLPLLYRNIDNYGRTDYRRSFGGDVSSSRSARRRVRVVTCWHKMPIKTKKIWGGDWSGEIFDPEDEDMAAAEGAAGVTITDAMTFKIYCTHFVAGAILDHMPSPFKHERLPFTAYWCFRRGRDGMPYGFIRGLRDAQESLNKRVSKALHALSTNGLKYEEGAFEDPEEAMDQVARPNMEIAVKKGYFEKVEIIKGTDIARGQFEFVKFDADHMHEGSGINRDNMGMDSRAESGKAILAKQQEGSVTTASVYDNFRLARQIGGEKTLSLIEQFMTEEKQIRIVGERGKLAFERINTPVWDEATGEWVIENDITATKADFVVAEQDFRESIRQAQAEQLFEMIKQMQPEVALALLDIAVDLMDIPDKEEFVQRIRSLNGQFDPDDENSPEQIAAMQQKANADAVEQELARRERMAKVSKDEAAARKADADAQRTTLGTKKEAIETASVLSAAAPLAPAADQLMATPERTS